MSNYCGSAGTFMLALSALVFVPVALAVGLAPGFTHWYFLWRARFRAQARVRAVVLAPLAGVLPLLAMQFCVLVIAARDPGCDFTWAAKPGWIEWRAFDIAELVFGGLGGACVLLALVRGVPLAARLAPPPVPRCAGCGYDLTGLKGPVCPECGTGFGGVSLGGDASMRRIV
jgi:hypothetical protein